jgi:hypothetical protein
MLFKIQKELIQNRNMKLSLEVETDISKYKRLKKEYEKLPATAKQKLTPQFQVYLLLLANSHNDLQFGTQLFLKHNYENIKDATAQLALGRFYAKCGQRNKVINLLLPLLDEKELQASDLEVLFMNLFEIAQHGDCERVLQYALENYPNDLGWKIEALTYQIMLSHRYPQNQEDIVNNLKYLYPRCQTANEYNRMAICLLIAGYFDDGLKTFDLSLQKIEPAFSVEKTLPFDSSKCRESMDEIIDILAINEIKAFPVFGSLLGLVRDGKFMEYDKDADIGIFVNHYDEVYKVALLLCELPKFLAPAMLNDSKESHFWNLPIWDVERNVGVDLFFFHRQESHFEAGLHDAGGIFKWQFMPFELVQRDLAGKTYWLPNNTEQHLTELYGDWLQPVEVWDSLVNCPNIALTSKPVVFFYGLKRLYDALNEGKGKKALNYYQTLTARWGMQFSEDADRNIKKLLEQSELIK